MRELSLATRLRRIGFLDTARAHDLLEDASLQTLGIEEWLDGFAHAANPDQCLLALLRLAESCRDDGTSHTLLERVCARESSRIRLVAILGHSAALGDYLISHPGHLAYLLEGESTAPWARGEGEDGTCEQPDDGADADGDVTAHMPGAEAANLAAEQAGFLSAVHALPGPAPLSEYAWEDGVQALRSHYYARILSLAAADLTSPDPLAAYEAVATSLSDIVGGALEAGLALARTQVEGAHRLGFSVIAMGKTGGHEVNYVSDVDVMYVVRSRGPDMSEEEAIRLGTQVATALGRALSAPGKEPALWPLDANLRPEGADGPLVRTLDSYVEYYRRWAEGWEFQALLKARAIAGDKELGDDFVAATREFVWNAASREGFVEDSRAMRARVEEHIPGKEADRQLKLGKGGLRDVEFTVQLLQLVHGRTDESLRVRSTLAGLRALSEGGYVSRGDAARLEEDYRTLRVLEHRIQLQRLRRSHLVPTGESELRQLARSMGMPSVRDGQSLEELWQRTRADVRSLHQDIYYRPLLPLAARLSADDIALSDEAARARLAAIGYRNPSRALAHIAALTDGYSRATAICRQLLPVMLGWFAEAPDPDGGLLAFRILFEKAGTQSYFMRTLRDGGAAAERLCHVLGASTYLATNMPELPESVAWLADMAKLKAPSREALEAEMASMLGRRSEPSEIAGAGRYLRRRELLRGGLAQVLGAASGEEARRAVSLAADIAVHAALEGAVAEVCGTGEAYARFLVVAMGRMGGQEMCYASDADLVFVYEPFTGMEEAAQSQAGDLASSLKHLLTEIGPEAPLAVDFDLRPEGKAGPLARSIDSYEEYLERWASTWEYQALLRARPCAGSPELAERFVAMIDRFRYPADGLSPAQIREIRLMKARVENERIPHGIRPERHVKLGRGGQADVEWTLQLLQLCHAGHVPTLRVGGTLAGLRAAREARLLSADQADTLAHAWELASLMRDLNFLASGRSTAKTVDVLASSFDDLAHVAYLAGRSASEGSMLEEEYLRATRRARKIVDGVFYG